MNTFEAIQSRRVIKHHDPNHQFTPEEEKQLLEAALLSHHFPYPAVAPRRCEGHGGLPESPAAPLQVKPPRSLQDRSRHSPTTTH